MVVEADDIDDFANGIRQVAVKVFRHDHLLLGLPGASDHGQVIARLRLYDETHGLSEAGL